MPTVLSAIIEPALLELGVLAEGEAATQGQGADGLRLLNDLLDAWKLERLTVYRIARTEVALASSVALDRPVTIDRVNLLDTAADPEHETPLRKLTDDEYQRLPEKEREAERPDSWYYDPTYPLGTLYVFPVPTGSDLSLVIYALSAVDEFDAVTEDLDLPPGYRRMLRTNLAVELAASYSRVLPPGLVRAAEMSMAKLKNANVRLVKTEFSADVPGVSRGRYDIEAG